MPSSTIAIERRGADASAPDTQTPETVGADRSPVEHAPQGLRRVVGGLWQSLRQAPAYY
jgi:hypothetical protein